MIDRLGVHRFDDAKMIRDRCGMGKQIAQPMAGIAVLLELEGRTDQRQARLIPAHPRESLAFADGIWKLLSVDLIEVRLLIE